MTAPVLIMRGVMWTTVDQQATALREIGRGLSTQLETLSGDPTASGCEQMAANLDGARRAVLRLREALMSHSPPPDAVA